MSETDADAIVALDSGIGRVEACGCGMAIFRDPSRLNAWRATPAMRATIVSDAGFWCPDGSEHAPGGAEGSAT